MQIFANLIDFFPLADAMSNTWHTRDGMIVNV